MSLSPFAQKTCSTRIMGILNVTPDSFFDKGRFFDHEKAIQRGMEIYKEGADIIDIGGESTRPGAEPVTEEEELQRIIPVIEALHQKLHLPISIDTTKASIAALAIEAGASLINDVSGFQSEEMCAIAASSSADLCLMHRAGTPQTMQLSPSYPEGVIPFLLKWFEERVTQLMRSGIKKERIMLDPGIGFGKTVAHNLEIIQNLQQLKTLGFPLLLGVSRKSFMGKILNKQAVDLLPATLMVNSWAVLSGVEMIRVHDVAEHRQIVDLISKGWSDGSLRSL